jgi:hypothetical protein
MRRLRFRHSLGMKRRLLNLLTALSLLLCVAVCVLWVRSYTRPEAMTYARPRSGEFEVKGVSLSGGIIGYSSMTSRRPAVPIGLHWFPTIYHAPDVSRIYPTFGLPRSAILAYGPRPGLVTGTVPCWIPALLTAILPALWIARRRTRRRRNRAAHGLCPSCGYDLRATPGRCPECGTGPAVQRAALDSVRAVGALNSADGGTGIGPSTGPHPGGESCVR